jgi:hypothetical protein
MVLANAGYGEPFASVKWPPRIDMLVLALEYDPIQAAAIRRVVCDTVGARLALVNSVAEALHVLRGEAPDLLLLPALIAPGEESQLIQALRTLRHGRRIETCITPMLGSADESSASMLQRWRRSVRRTPDPGVLPGSADQAFAERLLWSLERVRHQEPVDQDRRRFQRFPASELRGFRFARIKFGPMVGLIDVSAGGALLESNDRLRPESEVMLELVGESRNAVVPVRVLRCQVAGVDESLRYLGACAFKEPLDLERLLVEATPRGLLALGGSVSSERMLVRNCW